MYSLLLKFTAFLLISTTLFITQGRSIAPENDIQVAMCPGSKLAIPNMGTLGWSYMDDNIKVLETDGTAHRGIDLWPQGPDKTSGDWIVRAAHNGVITQVGGTSIRIGSTDDPTFDTYYGHVILDDYINKDVRVKQTVVAGQRLGLVDPADYWTVDPKDATKKIHIIIKHLHFVVMKYGIKNELIFEHSMDPSPYLNAQLNYFDITRNKGLYKTGYDRTILEWCNSKPEDPKRLGSVSGVVRLPNGDEVSNVLVSLEGLNQTRLTNFWQGPEEHYSTEANKNKVTWSTQKKGAYTFSNVPPGEYLIKATKAGLDAGVYGVSGDLASKNYIGYARVKIENDTPVQVADIILQPDTTPAITGYVKDQTGKGVSNADVLLRGITGLPTTKTDANGMYTFPSVPTGRYKIFARSDGLGEGAVDIWVPQYASIQALDIRLFPYCANVTQGKAALAEVCPGDDQANQGRDFVLIIDTSGSMAGNDPKRLRAEAAKLFAATIDPRDRLAVIGFTDSAYTVWSLQSVEGKQQSFNQAIDQYIGVYGGTNISDGLSKAYTQLDDGTSRPKVAILLTDGQQDPPESYDPKWQASFKQKTWPVYTFGLSNSADTTRLKDIATSTGGEYAPLNDASLLAQFYNNLRVEVTGNARLTDNTVLLVQGESYLTEITVPPFTQLAKIVTTWPGSEVNTVLQAPDGTFVNANTVDAFIEHDKQRTFEVYRLSYPMSGQWTVIAYGQELSPAGELVTLQADASVTQWQTFLPLISNGVAQPSTPPPEPISSVAPPTVISPSGSIRLTSEAPVTAGSSQQLDIRLSGGENTKWNAPAFTSDCNLTGIPSGFASESQQEFVVTTMAYVPPDAAGKICTITGTITTYGTVYNTTTFTLKMSFAVAEATTSPGTPTFSPTSTTTPIPTPTNIPTITPSPITKSITVLITADNQDGYEDPTFRLSGDGNNNDYIGTASDVMGGWVFANVQIPRGATITNAYVRFRGYGFDSNATARLHTFAQGNAPFFIADGTNKPSTRPVSSSYVDWPNYWSFAWQWFETPNLTSIVQEAVDRSDWQSGNALGFRISNPSGTGTNWSFVDYAFGPLGENGLGNSTTLYVTYTYTP